MTVWVNYDDIVSQLQACGFDLQQVELTRRKRVKIEGNSQKGWYSLYEIGLDSGDTALVGSYGWWVGAETFVHKFELRVNQQKLAISAEQREAIKAKADADRKLAAAEREREIERAARQAAIWWRKLKNAGRSAYLERKGFPEGKLYGARVSDAGNLVIPMQDASSAIYGLQVIYGDPKIKAKKGRDKDYTPPKLGKKGRFFQIGMVSRGGVLLLAEGFATGASLHEATGLPVAVAFDAGNLLPVALALHKAHRRDIKILVCSDDDYLTEGNPGRRAAEAAALAVDGATTWPIFPGERPTDHKGPTDFNDLHQHPDGGLQAVRAQVQAAIASAGWRVKSGGAGNQAHQGDGESAGGNGTDGRRRAQSVMALDDLVERFVPLDDGTGKYVFDTWTNRVAAKDQMITLLPAGVRSDDIKRHPVWVERGAYYLDQVGFDPSGKDGSVRLNTWKGWPMQPREGRCDRLLELLAYLCSRDPNGRDIYRWILCWMAYPLQHPGAKMSSAIIMHGPQGTGKSTVFQALAKIYGDYATVLNQRGLEDKFNSDWADSKLFILAEEVVTRAEMWHIKNELKELVTGEWIRVNPKNIAAYRQRNQVNIIYLSNEGQPLPLENDDRRHLVVYTPPALGEDFYDEVFQEIENGGVEAMYHHLLHLDLSGFHPKKRPPMTEAKANLIALSSPSELRFLAEYACGDMGLPVVPCLTQDMYAAYLRWCRLNGESRPRPSNQFFGQIAHQPGWAKKRARCYGDATYAAADNKPRWLIMPPPKLLQESGRAPKDGENVAIWLTNCHMDFAEAMKSGEESRRYGT
jgi:putative DNA primase/helicase